MTAWMKYAKWEEQQDQIDRARSIYERALDVEHRHEYFPKKIEIFI